MVHALREAWRVVIEGGTLIDLRPLSTTFPVDAIAGTDEARLGEGSATATLADDRASEAALREAVAAGTLIARERASFDIHYYFDTGAGLSEFLHTGRACKEVRPSCAEIDAAFRTFASGRAPRARLRCTRHMTLGAFTRVTPAR